MFKYIDSHAHIDFQEFQGSEGEIIKRADQAGVFKIINVGVDLERSKKSIGLAKKFKGIVYATVGLHPQDSKEVLGQQKLEELKALAKQSEVVAIGECGLDFFRVHDNDEKLRQAQLFQAQIDLSQELNLPLIIHTRDAEKETLEIIKQNKEKIRGGVVHCFTGSMELAKELYDLGFYIGFTGIITFDKTGKLEEVIQEIPLDKILIETDAPFLAPVPFRGKTNEPAYVVEVARKIAEVKKLSLEEVSEATTKNTISLFGLK